MANKDFYGIEPNMVPGFVGLGRKYSPFSELPRATQAYIAAMVEHLRGLHAQNPLGFEAVIGFISATIDHQDGVFASVEES